jgi:hypothetical protein
MSLIFERYEVINGQRDSWQNLLVKKWVESMKTGALEKYEKKFGIKSSDYCRNRYARRIYGGSDSHMGIFAGLSGTRFYVKDAQKMLKKESRSSLVLNALLD